jgi:hypothetical protein
MIMSDNKLLELAAKAVGIAFCLWHHRPAQIVDKGSVIETRFWNPLTDDGDALRLAVKLKMKVEVDYSDSFRYVTSAKCWSKELERCVFASEEIEPDPYAATRRAIVRAAAEIGKVQ